ncbi:MAG: helix-turn-helix domain-containing protein, partial [Spirochaetota bacterium]
QGLAVIELTEPGHEALSGREEITLKVFRDGIKERRVTAFRREGGSTTEETLGLLRQGMGIPEVAHARGLSERTIASHVATLIGQGVLELDAYVSPAVRSTVEKTLEQLQASGADLSRLRPIKDALPPDISYDELKFVLGAWQGSKGP